MYGYTVDSVSFNTEHNKLSIEDIVPFSLFVSECEKKKISTKGQLQWWMRYRVENGLLESGAVVEKYVNPRSKRPVLFIVKPKFVEWLSKSS